LYGREALIESEWEQALRRFYRRLRGANVAHYAFRTYIGVSLSRTMIKYSEPTDGVVVFDGISRIEFRQSIGDFTCHSPVGRRSVRKPKMPTDSRYVGIEWYDKV
jgi:hypothetical protein